jgi:hypothetical protein
MADTPRSLSTLLADIERLLLQDLNAPTMADAERLAHRLADLLSGE